MAQVRGQPADIGCRGPPPCGTVRHVPSHAAHAKDDMDHRTTRPVRPTRRPGLLAGALMSHLRRLGPSGLVGLLALLAGSAAAQVQELKVGGTGAALGTMRRLAQAYTATRPDMRITVLPSMGSGGGIKAVLAGAIQIALSSRALSDAEVRAGAVETEYGRTPLVFATAAASTVAGITSRQLVDWYAGSSEQWPDGSKLRLVLRPVGDSDTEAIKAMSPAMHDAATMAEQRKGMNFALTDQDAATALEKVTGALGLSTLAQIVSEKRALKALVLDGVAPGIEALARERYPLHKRLALVSGPKSPPAAQDFIAFVRSPEGRELLRQTGHWVK